MPYTCSNIVFREGDRHIAKDWDTVMMDSKYYVCVYIYICMYKYIYFFLISTYFSFGKTLI